jgi:hypothetical protein
MQELIDLMKSHEARGWGNMTFDFFFAQLDEMKALEKEKEQIEDAYLKGYIHYLPKIDSKEYYNQTYNQKQHIIDIMKADEDDGLYNQNKS